MQLDKEEKKQVHDEETSSDDDRVENDYKNSHLVKCRYYRNKVP
jgi:hypothetical protein